ncbi:MAG: ribosome biogenesis factor YjgA [Gammaproteobacteria bacterium]
MKNEIRPLPDGPLSKTKVKKQMHELQDFGELLLELPAATLKKLPLDERLQQAIADWKKVRSWEAKRRHIQFIGRILREGNGEEVRAAYEEITDPSRLQRIERLRDALVADDEAVQAFIGEHPDIEVTPFRQMVRSARKEREEMAKALEAGLPPGNIPKSAHYQKLFQLLKEITG